MSRSHSAQHFSISQEDFERESVLKRRRQHSPARGDAADSSASSIAIRTRSKSKSRARESTMRRLPSLQGQEFFALGRSDRSRTASSTTSASNGYSSARPEDRGRKRERSVSKHSESNRHRTRSKSNLRALDTDAKDRPRFKSKVRALDADAKARTRSKSQSRKRTSSRRSPARRSGSKRARSQSTARADHKSNARPTVTASSSSPSPPSSRAADRELQRDIERNEKRLSQAKGELSRLEGELAALQARVDTKKYEVMDLQIVVDGLNKRVQLQEQFLRRESFTAPSPRVTTTTPRAKASREARRSPSPERELAGRGGKRRARDPRVVHDEDESDEDDDVEIVDPREVHVKTETPRDDSPRRASSSSSSRLGSSSAVVPAAKPVVDQTSDYFWGRVSIAKLLVQPRTRLIPDGSNRKGRHLAFNPIQQDVFAVGSDDGGLILWNYSRQTQEVAKVVSFDPASFRKDNQCAESIAWSPDGERLAISFRDPLEAMGEFCVVRLHQLALTGGQAPQMLPRDRVKSKCTTLHARGISAIDWVPGGYGDRTGSRGVVTTGPDHAVVLWEEHRGQADYKWRVLHREHRSDVRSICMHSQGNAIYTSGLDGLVVRYDMNSQRTHAVLERRRPQISKINAVLENPHNPNLLLVSCVEQSEQNLLLHDLRERFDEKKTMTLSWIRSSDSRSMSQYIVPRWSPGSFHVSCGSTSGQVNIWDVRVRGDRFPLALPQQSISVHQKQVLHATWHPRYDAMFSVSHDRNIGLLTFR